MNAPFAQTGECLVAVVDFDISGVLQKLVGMDPRTLAEYARVIERIAIAQIEASRPASYQGRGEVYRMAWLKDDSDDLTTSIFKLFLSLKRELDRANEGYKKKGLPPATFHAGVSMGKIEFGASSLAGEGAESAYRCAERARSTKALLVVVPEILKDIPHATLQSAGLHQTISASPGYITVNMEALEHLSGGA